MALTSHRTMPFCICWTNLVMLNVPLNSYKHLHMDSPPPKTKYNYVAYILDDVFPLEGVLSAKEGPRPKSCIFVTTTKHSHRNLTLTLSTAFEF